MSGLGHNGNGQLPFNISASRPRGGISFTPGRAASTVTQQSVAVFGLSAGRGGVGIGSRGGRGGGVVSANGVPPPSVAVGRDAGSGTTLFNLSGANHPSNTQQQQTLQGESKNSSIHPVSQPINNNTTSDCQACKVNAELAAACKAIGQHLLDLAKTIESKTSSNE